MIIIYNFVNFLIVSVIFGVVITGARRDEYKWWCADPECKAPIGEGICKSNYVDENSGQLFKKNEKILVLRKTIPPPEKGLLWIQLKSNGIVGQIPQNLIHVEKVNVKDGNLLLFDPQTSTPIIHSSSTEVYDGTTLVDKQNDEVKHIYSPATSTDFTSSDSTVVPNPLASISKPSVSPIESKQDMPTYKADEGSFNSTNVPILDPRDDLIAPHEDHVSDGTSSTDGVFNPISPTSFMKSIETGVNAPKFNSTDPNSETRIESTRNSIVREDDSERETFSDREPRSSQFGETLLATSGEPVHKPQVESAKNRENNNLDENKSSSPNYHKSPSGDGSINSEVMKDNSLPESSSMTPFQNTYNYMNHENKIGNGAPPNVWDSPSDGKSSVNEITNSVLSIEKNSPESSTNSPFQNGNTSEYQEKQIGNDTPQNPNVPTSPSDGKSSDNQFAESAPKIENNTPGTPAKSPFQNVYSHIHREKKIENDTPELPSVPNIPSNKKSSDSEITYSTSDMTSPSEPSYTLSTKHLQPAELQKSQENNDSETTTPSSDDPHVILSGETSNSVFSSEGSLPQLTVPGEGPQPTPGTEPEALPTNSSEQIAETLKDSSFPFASQPVQFTPDTLRYGGRKEVGSSVGQLEPGNQFGTPPTENINSGLDESSSEFAITESSIPEISTTESTSSEKTFASDEIPISEVSQLSVDSEKTESPSAENEKDELDQVVSEVFEENSIPWYSSIVDNLQSIFSSEKEEIIHESIPTLSTTLDNPPMCQTDDCFSQNQPEEPTAEDSYGEWPSLRSTMIIIITTVAVIIFSLGYYYLENLRRDTELISKYNDLSGKLFIEQTEKEMLSKQLIEANDSLNQISTDSSKNNKEIEHVKAQLKFYKDECATLTEKEKETSKKFTMVDKNYNELRKILSQTKQKGERSALIADIKTLKDSIEANNIEIASLKEQLLEKKEEIKALNNQIIESRLDKEHLAKTLEETITDGHKQVQQFQESIAQLEKIIEENAAAHVTLEQECTQLKKEKESLTLEKELVESSLQKFQRLQPGHSLKEWLNAKEVRVALLTAEKKLEEMTIENSSLLSDKNHLEDKLGMLTGDLKHLDEKYETAEKEKIEALTKLQVLSDYFKEKETQLQEELGSKESLWLEKQSDDRTIYEQMRALREENASFKNQNETLKREILEQEASFKKLITSAEEKAHENWVALRHHERRLKEAHMEAAQLRSRLTALEATGDNGEDKIGKDEVNGDIPPFGSATSPPFMLYPEFLPPPPLVSATPSRPPPLGRISSPPLDDFTPPPPLVPYEMFLPQSPPPPHQHGLPHVVHKPQPLERNHRVQKDSQSSNHSSESGPDKPRRNKR